MPILFLFCYFGEYPREFEIGPTDLGISGKDDEKSQKSEGGSGEELRR